MGVYILAKQTRGVKYLYAIETQYVEQHGKRKRTQRVLKSFGRLDRLLKEDPNIIEHLKTLYCRTRTPGNLEHVSVNTSSNMQPIVTTFSKDSEPTLQDSSSLANSADVYYISPAAADMALKSQMAIKADMELKADRPLNDDVALNADIGCKDVAIQTGEGRYVNDALNAQSEVNTYANALKEDNSQKNVNVQDEANNKTSSAHPYKLYEHDLTDDLDNLHKSEALDAPDSLDECDSAKDEPE